jgi:glycosyltransferase involved in cell wall biosynthesis
MPDRLLHIGVDGRELLGQPTGVGRYVNRILQQWTPDRGFPHKLSVFVPTAPPAELAASLANARWHVEGGRRGGTLWEQGRLPAAVRRTGVDVLFAPGYTAPFRLSCPFVVTIHDVSFFAHPEWFGWREGLRRRWLTRQTARRAAAVTTVSNFSAGEIVRWLGVPGSSIRLAPPGPPDVVGGPEGPRDPTVLFVGSLFARRRIPELVRAFALVQRRVPGARLIIVGGARTPRVDPVALATRLGIESAVRWREYVTETELTAIYGQARAFAFLSDYEGFAITPLEALAHDTPIVLLDTPVSREIYGDAALLVPADERAIADALERVLTDGGLRAALVRAGRDRLAAFSWTRTADVVQAALEDAARRP